MSFPPTYDFPVNAAVGDDVTFTDIHVDPASLPAPAPEPIAVLNDSEEEEEEEEEEESEEEPMEEEDPEEDPIEENPPEEENEPQQTVPSPYTPEGSRPLAMRTARMSVRFPSTDYTSGPSRSRHSRTPSPVPPMLLSAPLSVPLSPATVPHPPSPPFPGNLPIPPTPVTVPPTTSRNALAAEWIANWENSQPTQGTAAPASSTQLPQTHEDPTVAQLLEHASNVDLRIMQLEDNVEAIPGSDQLENLDDQVQDMDERMNRVEHRMGQMNDRVLARGALVDHVQSINVRLRAVEVERDYLLSRVRDLERYVFDMRQYHR